MDKVGQFWDTTEEKREAIQARIERLFDRTGNRHREREVMVWRLEAVLHELEKV